MRPRLRKLSREQYKDYVGEDYYNSVIKTLDGNLEIQGNILSASTEDYKFWSNFKTEDAYKTWLTQQEEEQKQLSFDLTAGQAEIDDIQKAFDEFTKLNLQIVQRETAYAQAGMTNPREMAESDADLQGVVARINELSELYGVDARSGGLKSLLSEKKAYYTLAERAQKAKELASVADVNSQNYDIEFEKYAAQGKSMDNGNIPWEFFGNTVADNPIEALRRYYADSPSVEEDYGAGKIGNEAAFALAMTEDEVNIYNYYLAKEGKDKAEEYLDLIAESVNSRVASGYFSLVEGKPALEYYFGVVAGVDQFASGMTGWFADGYTPASAVQMAGGLIREDLADVGATLPDWLGGEDGTTWGQVGYDFLNTTANMLPSILASAAANYVVPGSGAYVGATLMGASAGGNAKVEMLNLGYTKEQANAYGAMVAVAEGSMEYLLGGITKLGGKLPEGITSAILSKVDNAFARAAIKLGGNMLSEGFEEGLQTVIEPWLKEIATGVDWEAPNIDEILYSSLLGALSAFGLEGAGVVAGEVGTYKSGKQIQKIDGGVERLQKLGQTFSADSVAYKIAGKVNAQTDAYTIGRLLNEVGATISEQNLTEIVNGLTAKGMGTRTANTIARQYQSFLNNEMRMTDEQVKILENLSPLADVLRTNIIGSNTTVYQRTRAYSDLMNLADEVSNRKKGDVSKTETTEKTTSPISIFEQNDVNAEMKRLATEVATGSRMSASERAIKRQVDSASETAADRLGVEGRYTSSDTGATRLASNKKRVNIVGVDSIEDGVMNLKLNDGSVVSADDIDFSTSDEALVYEAVANMRVNANTAWEILKGYDPKSNQKGAIYAMGALEAYTYGHNGVKVEGMSQDGFSALLSPVQKNTANRLGDIDARAKVDAQQKTIDKAVKSVRDEAKSKHKAIPKRKGEVVFEGKYERLTELQRSQIDVLEPVAKGLGVTFHIFESDENFKYTMPDGAVRSANGWYDPKTGEIWIDLKAGNFGQGTIIFTAAHELTHFIRQWSPAKFKIFADFLFEQYGKKGQDVNQLIQRQIEKAAARNRSISWDEAYEEVIADSCETFLRDSKAAEKIAALREKDVGLANKIKTFLGQMLAKMRKVMADLGLAPETPEGQMVAEMTDSLQKLYDLWTDALADAGTAYSTLTNIDFDTDSVAPMLSERTWTASEYVTEREATAKKISEALGVDMKTAYKYIDDINSIARLIADDRARLDYEPNLDDNATVLKPNSEYKYSVDMSTLCAKRLLFTGTFDAIQRALPNTVFDSEDIVALREMMQDRGYEVACGICYVESTRREIGRITQEFIDRYKVAQKTGKPISRINSSGKEVVLKSAGKTFNADKNYTPNLGELNTTDIDIVKRDHREVYDAYLAFMNARGQAKPKLLETRAEYKGEILKHFKSKSAVEARNNAGGLRLQSFSDFEVPHLIDMMQIVMDMSRVGLKSQAYTKVPAFAEVFGGTGVKINLSLIAKGDGLDANGNLVFDDVEGINHKEAFKLRDKYSKNVGTILVGKTDAHIIAAMADPRIDYIIPFHKSSWKESLYDALGLTGYADYTDYQNEKPIDKDRKIKNFDPSEYWDFSKSGDENAQIYLAKCREDGRIPKFPQFQGYPGYWKLLIDFKMYDNDGVGSPQEVVRPTFNTEASERILSDYKGGHKSFPVAKDVVEDFVKEHKSKNNTSENNGIRYSSRETLAEASSKLASIEDEDYLKDKEANPFVLVMENTPTRILDSMEGSNDRKILIRRDALYLAIRENGIQEGHYHGLGEKVLAELPKYLEDPDVILSTLDPNTKDESKSRRLVLTHIPAKNGQAIISIEFDTIKDFEGKNEYFNLVVTVFDLHENYLKRQFNKFGAKVKYQKEDLAQVNPQLFEWLRTINAKSSDKSIAQDDDSVNRDTEKNSLRNVEPIETADYVKMYHHFGSTKNYDVAGYILGNGMMLDFSGKHWGDDYSTSRQVDHRDIQETLGNRGSNNGVNAMIDMIGNGNIRLMPEVGGINLAVKPNATQMSQLRGYINHFKGEVEIDIDEVGGDTIHSFNYTRGTSSAKILADIKAYFDEGIVPQKKDEGETNIRQFLYSDRVVDKKTVDFLENQEHVTVYRAMQVIDGKLYPPMNAYTYDENGKKVLMPPSEIGAWEQSVERPDLIDPKTGKFKLDKGKVDTGKRGTPVPAAYNPYIHTSLSMLNDQFTSAYQRSNLVVVKGVVPKSELTSGYRAQYAKDTVGETEWHSGVVSTQLPKSRKVILSRWFKPVEILSNDDVAESIKEMLADTDIEIPYNVVSPGLRRSLESIGVPIGEGRGIKGLPKKDEVKYSDRDSTYMDAVNRGDMETAQRMVEEAAREAGYTRPLYHGTADKFNVFKFGRAGIYTTDNYDVAKTYGGNIVSLYGKQGAKVLTIDAKNSPHYAIRVNKSDLDFSEYPLMRGKELYSTNDISQIAFREGYDVVVIKNVYDNFSIISDNKQNGLGTDVVYKDSNQVKSADPVTYDDNGNVIPLSERFNSENDDIRYSDRSPSSVSTRSLLANALETTAQNDIEKTKLAQYKSKIELIESEYAKLSEIKKQANDLRFTKGRTADETKRLKALDFEANQIANRINVYDRQLLNLEATTALKNVLQREKKLAYDKAKKEGKDALAKYREKAAKTQKELMNRNTESRKKAIESRDKTAMRKKIRKVIKDINHLFNHGNKQRNIKEGMKDTVASALALGEVLFNDDIKNEDIVRLGVDSVTESESILLNEYRDLLDLRDDLTAEIEARYDNGIAREDLIAEVGSVEEKLAKVKNRISTLNSKLADVFERERTRLNKATIDGLINNLAYEYSKLQQSEDSYIKNAYVEAMHTRLTTLAKSLEGKIVKDMDIYQLAEVYDTFTSVKHMISTANSLFFEERNEELMTFVSNVQTEMYEYANDNPKDPIAVLKNASDKVDAFAWNELKPVYAFDKLGSETFKKLFWDAIEAEGKYAVMIDEARAFNEDLREKHGFAKWDLDTVVKEFTLADGKVFKLTLEDMMSIYAYSRRTNKLGINQSTEHMTEGGFVFDENNEYKPSVEGFFGKFALKRKHAKLTTTYRIDDTVLKAVKEFFNAKDNADKKAYVEAMQDYMTAMGEKGNEVSRKLFGIDIFTELVYMPLQSSADYLNSNAQALSKTPTQASLKNVGMSKPTTPGANNPIVLRAFDQVWFEHIDQMSKYVALVLPIENLQRVFNNVAKVKGDSDISTQALIEAIYGKGARQYFDKYITDLNGGVMSGGYRTPLMEMFGKAKKVAVSASLSVWVQQYFAIVRAMDMIRPDYFIPFLRHQDTSIDMSLYEEMRKYAPISIIKEMGGFEVGSGRSAIGFMNNDRRGLKGKMEAFDEYSNIGAEVMDKLGWMTIWSAVKKEVATKQKLTPGTEEFFAACKKRFTEVIVYTQVYDSVNSRSGLMRSQNDLDKFATSFMGEPTVTVNMVDKRLHELKRAIKKKDKKAIGKAAGKLGRTLTSVIASITLSSLAKAMIGANRDDEEDEAWLEKWMKHFGSNLKSELNPLGMIPYLRDIVSIWEGWTVDRPDMGLIADVVSSAKKCLTDGATIEEVLSLSGDVANAFGVPAKNIVRDVNGLINFGKAIFDDIHPTDMGGAFVEGITGEERTKQTSLYNAIVRGDTGKIEAIKATYKTDSAYETAVKTALRDNDPRIKEAAKAYGNGDIRSYSNYVNTIVAEGHFDAETVEGAIRSELSAFNTKINQAAEAKNKGNDAEYKKIVRELRDSYRGIYSQDDIVNLITKAQNELLNTEDDDIEEATSIYKASDVNTAFESGDTDMALEVIEDLINTKVENYLAEARKEAEKSGKKFNEKTALNEAETKAKSSIRSSMTSYWKPLYKEAYKSGNTAEQERIKKILKDSGLYGTASEVIKTVREWRTERD